MNLCNISIENKIIKNKILDILDKINKVKYINIKKKMHPKLGTAICISCSHWVPHVELLYLMFCLTDRPTFIHYFSVRGITSRNAVPTSIRWFGTIEEFRTHCLSFYCNNNNYYNNNSL